MLNAITPTPHSLQPSAARPPTSTSVARPASPSTPYESFIELSLTLLEVVRDVVVVGAVACTVPYIYNRFFNASARQKRENARHVQERMVANGRVPFEMNEHETRIAADMVYPSEIDVEFSMIGGLEKVKQQVFDLVALPLQRPDLFVGKSALLRPPKGILLYGPPGTGKTMLAKAIAKESGAAFIDLKLSTTMDMWFGESQKLVRATFSLAWKLSPCIIFIDEIDAFLRDRANSHQNSALQGMQAEFMALWDGMSSNDARVTSAYGIIIIGATNRPYDIDRAILRRMPRQFKLDLPDAFQRRQILEIILKDEDVERGVREGLAELAWSLDKYSGSDLKELCRNAAARPLEELSRQLEHRPTKNVHVQSLSLRKISLDDLRAAREEVKPTGVAAEEYRGASEKPAQSPEITLHGLIRLLVEMGMLNVPNGNYNVD